MAKGVFKWNILTKMMRSFTRFQVADYDNGVLKFRNNDLVYKYKTWYMEFDTSAYLQGSGGLGGVIAESGMAGDTADPGTTLGSWIMNADADTITFSIQVPDDWCGDGQAESLILQFFGKSTTQQNGIDVTIYHKTSTGAALVTDVVEIPEPALAWATFTTLSSGIGAIALQPGDLIDIVISPDGAHTTELERIRWKYKPGIKLLA